MPKLVAKCGIDCDTCPWGPYPRKGMTTEDFEQYRNNAKRILGYMPIKTPCLTCRTPDSEIPKGSKLPNRKCLIRQCVDNTGVENCAYCTRFPCDTVKATSGVWNRDSIEKKLGKQISEEEYHTFVEPFEGLSRLEAIRASLKSEEIVEPARASTPKIKTTDFPENLHFSKGETASFKAVHRLLTTINRSSLGMHDTDTFAQQHRLENRRAHVLRFLWILGLHGKVENAKSANFVVDARTYEASRGTEKMLAIWSFVKDTIFNVLSELGVCCELVPMKGVKEVDLATGTGYLRGKGWVMKMSFAEKVGGVGALKALNIYVRRLDGKYGGKAFQYFSNADMQILLEK